MSTKMDQKFDFGGLGPDFEELEFGRIFEARKMKSKLEKKRKSELLFLGGARRNRRGRAEALEPCKDLYVPI